MNPATPDGLVWRKSSHSEEINDCVEITRSGDRMLMRDSKDPAGPVLSFTQGEWDAFLKGVAAGEFDQP